MTLRESIAKLLLHCVGGCSAREWETSHTMDKVMLVVDQAQAEIRAHAFEAATEVVAEVESRAVEVDSHTRNCRACFVAAVLLKLMDKRDTYYAGCVNSCISKDAAPAIANTPIVHTWQLKSGAKAVAIAEYDPTTGAVTVRIPAGIKWLKCTQFTGCQCTEWRGTVPKQ